jgi:glycerophosphoryl diester phosphodiesterase
VSNFDGTFFEADWPLVVGHRGNPARHPDNSLAGAMSGLAEVGAVEVDVRLTRDGHLILSHDPEIEGRSISATVATDLLAVEPRPCLLDEILSLPGRLNLEIKNIPGEEGFDPDGRAALLSAARGRPIDLFSSFFWPDMDLVKARAGSLQTGLVVGEGGPVADTLAHAADNDHIAVSAHHTLIDDHLCMEAAGRDMAVVAWTVNTVDRARELSGMGVAAIISDDPLLIRNGLRE